MLREIIGAIFAAFIGTLVLWAVMPALKNIQSAVFYSIDSEDPTTAMLFFFGDILYLILGWVVVFVIGFAVLSRAARSDTFSLH